MAEFQQLMEVGFTEDQARLVMHASISMEMMHQALISTGMTPRKSAQVLSSLVESHRDNG